MSDNFGVGKIGECDGKNNRSPTFASQLFLLESVQLYTQLICEPLLFYAPTGSD